jgi:hypothetical protein
MEDIEGPFGSVIFFKKKKNNLRLKTKSQFWSVWNCDFKGTNFKIVKKFTISIS